MMSFSKNDLEIIKSKIQLSSEIEKKSKLIKKGSDYWCCCPFHEEKTPSCKINDDLGSYYCFGCGAKGDIFTIYTELYNYSFPDAVKELASRVGIKINENNPNQKKENENIFKILEMSTTWFEDNLNNDINCQQYLKNRALSKNTIRDFRIGYSYNPKTTLYAFLKDHNFSDKDIINSNVVKKDKIDRIRDFFYKRLIFPIANEQNKILGFGGRVLDNSNPKYINSPESFFFKKRDILYNLNLSKKNIRLKKNILICEGYMDVISLYENNIKTAVAPLGTSLTDNQLQLSWKYVNKPTIMFDGDNAGLRASYKSALMALNYLSPNKYLQFIKLPQNYDPDSFINKYSIANFIKLLKKPTPIVNFIFEQSTSTIDFNLADNKVTYDKFIDDIVNTIKDKKISYFYKNEFKKLFFDKLKSSNKKVVNQISKKNIEPLLKKQINSFLLAFLNHASIRGELIKVFKEFNIFNESEINFINFFEKKEIKSKNYNQILEADLPEEINIKISQISKNTISQLFPYTQKDYDSSKTLEEIRDSIKNLNTRLLNLKKINKSLNEFENTNTNLSWDELKKIYFELHGDYK